MAAQGERRRTGDHGGKGARRLGLIALLLIGLAPGCKRPPPPPPPPPEVQVVVVEPRDLPIHDEWIATLDGSVNAQIRAQVTGYLKSQDYAEGSHVHQGDLLFTIDPRPFQAALDQAKAKLAQDRAMLGKSQLDVKRYTPLAREQAISEEELDNAVQSKLAASAQVKADQAAVETAQVNLGFTRIASPIEGLAGIALAQIGDLVSPSSGPLTTVSTIDPVKAYFQISEQLVLAMGPPVSWGGEKGPALELLLANGSRYPIPGKVAFADRQVNPTTGTLQVVGLFPNPDSVLRPGQYARVRAQTRIERGALAIPQRAVSELQGSHQVAVVDPDNRIHIHPVTLGTRIGSSWIVSDGVKPGDRVVVEGVQKVRDGNKVRPKLVENRMTDTLDKARPSPPGPDAGDASSGPLASDPPATPDGGAKSSGH